MYDFDHENKIIYTDLTIKDLDDANTIFAGWEKEGYKIIARNEKGETALTFTSFQGMNQFMEDIDPSGDNGVVLFIGLTGSLGAGGTNTVGGGVMMGISSDGIKINGYTKINPSLMFGATIAGGIEGGINFGTGNPHDLDGAGSGFGGSLGDGVYAGGDVSIGRYPGVSFGIGLGVKGFPLPGEVHGGMSVYFIHGK
jgi:hypothetical protein